MKKTLTKILCLLLAFLMLLSFAACSDNKETAKTEKTAETPAPSTDVETSENNEVARFVENYGSAFTDSFEANFESSSGMPCSCNISAEGSGLIIDCYVQGLDDVPEESKQQIQEVYDSMTPTIKEGFADMKAQVPSLEYVTVNVCEKDGDILAVIDIDLD